ncbi:ammonia-dependent NAD(+) synthetase [Salipaludibacillus agaradhaerens]|jgi:NAD+ synthase|uniref:NH(3)-dependent NAD(+) synthetase n=1 Tax=Salipaludibacillus agaradhaerens TaxID=76935 RepID=A0A9Q4FYX5_SALAG|nr:ammonia-dependent NAD(+) synthetase [Salipaludibacillus agaradhaerens]MCR6096198.1 ammonia-dependent NAD(+) synthetase [Salipaludibacillus agaradhaerens]MCR6114243.1 ammonia-dependent NAD(+) synthetase [Salipaludibacillus agaradhaerens]
MLEFQQNVIATLKVKPHIDPKEEIRNRINFLKAYVKKAGMKGYVLGISGGQDSSLLGKLIQLAMEELNTEEKTDDYTFIAVRLPYGEQADEVDAQTALNFIQPYKRVTVNIKKAVDGSVSQFIEATGETMSDFVKGNTKARERMKVQYDLAAHFKCLVAGTDHAAEAVTGFFTKFGDGACDVTPLFGLNKRQGKELLKFLEAPEILYTKTPTADLEDEQPLLSDEQALGMTYDQIDDYLEGKELPEDIKKNLERRYKLTEHKRQLPVTLFDYWWQS